jgi:signal transduction histidine kinase
VQPPKHRSILSGLIIGLLILLCAAIGILQYRWNAEVSAALRERLHANLEESLARLSRDFNAEISAACLAIAPSSPPDATSAEAQLSARYEQWKNTTGRRSMIRRIGLAVPTAYGLQLEMLGMEHAVLAPAPWPPEWKGAEDRLDSAPARGRAGEGAVFEMPIFPPPADVGQAPSIPFGPPGFGRGEIGWVLFEINVDYIRDTLLPEALQRHLGSGGTLDYQVEVVNRFNPAEVISRSNPSERDILFTADASAPLFDVVWHRAGRGPDSLLGRTEPPGPGPAAGRWEMFVRHKAGSLEAVVAQTRRRNLAVTGGVLLLMLATVGALVRFSRRAQRLAELQMDFVAGISHELRTPLTVIHTAAYNLQGKLSGNPAQVERYGKLIQQESGRLKDIVEQVLQFASAKAGRVIQHQEPIEVEDLIDQTIEASRAVVEAAHCTVEKDVEVGLPAIHGDLRALRLALENLVGNAAKYGSERKRWIGIFASATENAVEIRVADRGPGIPAAEQKRIFDAFFRGRRAVQHQVHGTGLGLNLVKKIVEAHGGSVAVRNAAAGGTEFIVRIPAMEANS